MANWDVIVLGLGGVGSAAAFHLASSPCRVLGIDQYDPPHDRGSSHGKTRVIRQAYFEHPCYVPLLRRAYDLWDELEARSSAKLFHRTGLVEIGPADGIVIRGVKASADEYQLDIEELSMSDVSARWPGLAGQNDWTAIVENNAGFLSVEQCVAQHLRLAVEAGAECRHGLRVLDWNADQRGVQVVTAEGTETARHLVIAAGPWARAISNLPLQTKLLRKFQYWFDPDRSGYKLDEGFPCFFYETADGFFYGFPSFQNAGVKVARHSGGQEIARPDDRHGSDPVDRKLIDRFVGQCLPGVSNRLKSQAGCYYTMTDDEHFIIDRHPEHAAVTLIAGLSGHGFKFTSVLGEIACRMAMGRATGFDLSLFGISRGL